nr:MAG TPA: hypothetical protein [Bacteriophage sp.]
MKCKCVENNYGNKNFILGQEYDVREHMGIWCPMLCRFEYEDPGALRAGKIFKFAMCKFEIM